ncbi:MAG: diphthamide biosynthesis enzyme Dph2 [Zestosphaera sp.]
MNLNSGSGLLENYQIDLSKIIRIINERRPSKVLLQIPEGFKNRSYGLVDYLASAAGGGVEIHVDAGPCFGACLIDQDVTKDYDLVIHLGHERYPYWTPPDNVVFADLQSKTRVSEEVINNLLSSLREAGLRRLAIYATAQHKDLSEDLVTVAREGGFDVVNRGSRLVLGCWFSDLDSVKEFADAVLVVAGGRFHALGVGLRLGGGKEVVAVDPYMNTYAFLKEYVIKTLKVRLGKVARSIDARSWLLVTGAAGQKRTWLVEELSRLIRESGGRYYIAVSAYLTRDLLTDLDSESVDAIIITSCPRLALEDFHDYVKPVLTPGEGFMALKKNLDPYLFPW